MIPKRQRGFDELKILIVTDNTFTVTPPMVFRIKLYCSCKKKQTREEKETMSKQNMKYLSQKANDLNKYSTL